MYDPNIGRFLSEDPNPDGTFADGPNNYAYVHNGPTNATDPTGLSEEQNDDALRVGFDGLKAALKGITRSPNAADEASRVAAAIIHTWNNNSRWTIPPIKPTIPPTWDDDDRVKGYYCYEWAYAFEMAFNYEVKSWKCERYFRAKLGGASLPSGGKEDKVHAWLAITSLETGKTIYVDDGYMFGGGKHVHDKEPKKPGWTGKWFPSDNPKEQWGRHIPDPYDHEGNPLKHPGYPAPNVPGY